MGFDQFGMAGDPNATPSTRVGRGGIVTLGAGTRARVTRGLGARPAINPEGSATEGFVALWKRTAALDPYPLTLEEAEEETALPYVTLLFVSDVGSGTTSGVAFRIVTLSVMIHARLPSLSEVVAKLVRATFGNARLPLVGSPNGQCQKSAEGLHKAEGKGPGVSDMWVQNIDFDVYV